MQRYKLTIEYDGTPFFGWQKQDDGLTVQQSILDAVFKFSQEHVSITAAGRTDTGVHARGQVIHFDLEKDVQPFQIMEAINAHLRPLPIAVLNIEPVDEKFDARFSCKQRIYEYHVYNRRAPLVLEKNRAWQIGAPLDVDVMIEGAEFFLGVHDFTTFRATMCQAKSPIRTLDSLEISQINDKIIVRTAARAFLHSQVRSMVGSLVQVGLGKWQPQQIAEALLAKDRTQCGQLAPPCGLYFVEAVY